MEQWEKKKKFKNIMFSVDEIQEFYSKLDI